MAKQTVGQFTYDEADGTISGPASYMREQGNAKIASICAGTDEAFNRSAHFSPDVVTAILVHVQTDYAGWIGYKSYFGKSPR